MCSLKRIEIARNRKEIVISRISKKIMELSRGKNSITDFSAFREARNFKEKIYITTSKNLHYERYLVSIAQTVWKW